MRLRIPAESDYSKAAPALNTLREEDGWAGQVDTWGTNMATVAAWKDAGDNASRIWLPDEAVARTWQATVANFPRVVINYPTFDGNASFDSPPPPYWHNSILEANVPFALVASGPLGNGLSVKYFAGDRLLKVLTTHGSPYRVTLEGLPPGIHSIHAQVTIDGASEVSHPVLLTVLGRL